MAVDFTQQAEDLLKAAREARIPENVKAMAEDGVAKSRQAYESLCSATREQAQHTETMLSAVQAGSKTLADTVLATSHVTAELSLSAVSWLVGKTEPSLRP